MCVLATAASSRGQSQCRLLDIAVSCLELSITDFKAAIQNIVDDVEVRPHAHLRMHDAQPKPQDSALHWAHTPS